MGFTCLKYMYIVLLLLLFFSMACTLYTSQYRSKSKKYIACKHYLGRQETALIYIISGGIETHVTK